VSSAIALSWGLRVAAAAAAGLLTAGLLVARLDAGGVVYPSANVNAVWGLSGTLDECVDIFRGVRGIAFFGDSLAQRLDVSEEAEATPLRMEAELRRRLGPSDEIAVCNITHSGVTVWSLYYLADRIVKLNPEVVVVEFNLFNFSAEWLARDRKDLAVFLPASRIAEVARLPMDEVGLATDEWLFHRTVVELGFFERWMSVQHEQVRFAGQYWRLADRVQMAATGRKLELHDGHTWSEMMERFEPGRPRASAAYAKKLFGRALGEVSGSSPALIMLDVVLRRFVAEGITVLVYVPPYNLEHLRRLEVTDGKSLERTVAVVEGVARGAGASFLDLHEALPDAYFRDHMDHLSEAPANDGHLEVGRRLAAALAAVLGAPHDGSGRDAL
jgi:hypothetical protein